MTTEAARAYSMRPLALSRVVTRLALARAAVVMGGVLIASGCDKKPTDAPAPSASAAASVPIAPSNQPKPPTSAAPMGSNTPSADPMATLFGRMGDELKNRPNIHPNVDDAFAAIAKAGVPVPKPAQSLGTTYKAAYCSHGVAAVGGLAVLFCEYPDEEHAKIGLAESEKVFPTMKGRVTASRKSLLVTVTYQDLTPKPETVAAHDKVVATFKSL